MDGDKVVIIGAGPTGLGAAHHLHELGYKNWVLLERAPSAGGLASSVVDGEGFTWDLGGHVIFSHYDYFDRLVEDVLTPNGGWLEHQRESWVWMRGRYVPYPLQNNIHRLPPDDLMRCLEGLLQLQGGGNPAPSNFHEWIQAQFGTGLAEIFMLPYNFKVWAHPAKEMSYGWVGERVAPVDLKRVLSNLVWRKDDISWGPNAQFRFPLHGGTGSIWTSLFETLPKENVRLNAEVEHIDLHRKLIILKDGSTETYDKLLSTMPLDLFLTQSKGLPKSIVDCAKQFKFSASHIVGIGIEGGRPDTLRSKCWMYYPEDSVPFYRCTVFSNYSPNHVPDPSCNQWSLMLEVSQSSHKPVDEATIVERCIEACKREGLILKDGKVVSQWHVCLDHGYPVPFVGRDELLQSIQPMLKDQFQVWSRGRFGGWKYEVANQDHSCMQGVEAIDSILFGSAELTYDFPNVVNSKKSASYHCFRSNIDSEALAQLISQKDSKV